MDIPCRNEEPLYRAEIDQDEWKDLAEEYDSLKRQQDRIDLPQEDQDELQERLDELTQQIGGMHDITEVARRLPKKPY